MVIFAVMYFDGGDGCGVDGGGGNSGGGDGVVGCGGMVVVAGAFDSSAETLVEPYNILFLVDSSDGGTPEEGNKIIYLEYCAQLIGY